MDMIGYSALGFLARGVLGLTAGLTAGLGAASGAASVLVAALALVFGAAFFLAGASVAGSGATGGSGAGGIAASGEEATFALGVRLGLAGAAEGSETARTPAPNFGRGLGVRRLATRSAVALGGSGWASY